VSTGREMEWKVPYLDFWSVMIILAMSSFFFYGGMWSIVLLYMRAHDAQPGPALATYSQLALCCSCMAVKLKPSLIFFVTYLMYCCITAYIDPLILAIVPAALLMVLMLAPSNGRRGLSERSSLFMTLRDVMVDFAAMAYEHA